MVKVTFEAFQDCLKVANDDKATKNEHDAAAEAITAYRLGGTIGLDVASVLRGYVAKRGEQDRWGK